MESKRCKRIINELRELRASETILNESGIYFHYQEEKIDTIYCLIVGPENTPYEKGFYLFTFEYPPTYPMTPPLATFCTKGSLHNPVRNTTFNVRFNPNLYQCGKVCLSMLNTWKGEGWVPTMTIITVLIAIQGLVLTEEPLRNEPGYETANVRILEKYNQIVEYANIKISVLNTINQLPNNFEIFQDIVNHLFLKNIDYYKKFVLDRNEKYKDILIESNVYDMKCKLHYELLLKEIDDAEKKTMAFLETKMSNCTIHIVPNSNMLNQTEHHVETI
jgi:ubiquitin-protein ligase